MSRVLTIATLVLSLTATALAQCPGMGEPPPRSGGGGGPNPGGPGSPGGPTTPGPGSPTGPSTPGPTGPGDSTGPSTPRGPSGPDAPAPRTGGGAPSAPAPAAPATGAPSTPRTAGPAAPRAGAPGRGGPRGMPITPTRGTTSKERLRIDWDYPVHVPPSGQATVAVAALPAAEAFAEIAGDDPRPLLILRECRACAGTDLALLRNDEINDRTLVLTRWFHCVKLPADVLTAYHPFRNLFTGDHPSHLFLCLTDGSNALSLDGKQSQNDMWAGMGKVLRAAYAKDVEGPTKELLALLDQFDRVDSEVERLTADLDKELEKNGARSTRVASLQKKLKDAMTARADLLAREEKLRDLKTE